MFELILSFPHLQPDDVLPDELEPVREDPGPDDGLQAHVAVAHLAELPAPVVRAEVLLDDDGGGAHLQEAAAVVPAADAALEDLENDGMRGRRGIRGIGWD